MNYFIIVDISDDNARSIVKEFSVSTSIKFIDVDYFLSRAFSKEAKDEILAFTKKANESPVYIISNWNNTPENKIIVINNNLYPEDYKRFSEDENWKIVYIGSIDKIKLFPTAPDYSLLNIGHPHSFDTLTLTTEFLAFLLDFN